MASDSKGKGPRLDVHKIFHQDTGGFAHLQYHPLRGSSIDLGKQPVPVKAGKLVGAIPVSVLHEMEGWIPELREQVDEQIARDGYIGINTAYRPKPFMREDDFSRVNAVWVDCDCSRDTDGLDYLEAAERLFRLQARGVVPPISVIVNTGGGVHAYWLLTGGEDDPDLPPKGWRKNRVPMVQINEAIADRVEQSCPELKPDKKPTHITTHQRVAGSINSSTNTEVDYWIAVKDGTEIRYTLDQLTGFFGVEPYPTTYRRTRSSGLTKQPQKRAGHVARYQSRLEEFAVIRAYMKSRGGFPKGTRRWAVIYQATLMKPCGYNLNEMEHEALRVASESNPPLSVHEARTQFKSALKRQSHPKDTTIANKLAITVELADQLELKHLRPDSHPYRGTRRQKAQREARLRFLANLAEKHGGNPLPFTYAELETRLKTAGIGGVRGTIQNDLERLGLYVKNSPKARQKNQEGTPKHPTLPLVH